MNDIDIRGEGKMRNRGQLIFGSILLILGISSLLSVIFDVDLGAFCWPIAFIIVGVWLLVRPRYSSPEAPVQIRPIGDLRRRNKWQVSDQEIWIFVGDIELDMSEAEIPSGLTTLRVYGFVGEVRLRAPREVGVAVSSWAIVTDAALWGKERDYLFSPVDETSPGYDAAERKIKLETYFFVVDLRVEQE